MDKNTFGQIEKILIEFPQYESYIKQREEEVIHPYQITDTNQGGGQSNRTSDTTGMRAVSLAEDRILQRLKFQHRAVKNTYDAADDTTQKIIKEYYFKQPRTKTWDGVAYYARASKSNCLRRRNAFFNKLADELGMVKKWH